MVLSLGNGFAYASSNEKSIAGVAIDNGGGVLLVERATTDGVEDARLVLINTLTDWIRPQDDAPGLYQVRCRIVDGDGLNLTNAVAGYNLAANDTWLPLTTSRAWFVEEDQAPNIAGIGGHRNTNIAIDIGLPDGSNDPISYVTGFYNLQAITTDLDTSDVTVLLPSIANHQATQGVAFAIDLPTVLRGNAPITYTLTGTTPAGDFVFIAGAPAIFGNAN